MIVKEEVWRLERLHPLKRHLRIFDNLGVPGIADELNPRIRNFTAAECDRIVFAALGDAGYPHGGPLRMPRYPEGAQGHAAQGNRIPVLDDTIDMDGHHPAESSSGVVLAGFKRRGIAAESDDARSGQFFHRRVSLDVIKMRMARDDHLDVLDVEAQLLDVRHDDVVHLAGARVVEDVALRSRDQIRAILAAHPINVADDAEPSGRRRLILSLYRFRASRSTERCHHPDRCTEHQCTDLTHNTSLNL